MVSTNRYTYLSEISGFLPEQTPNLRLEDSLAEDEESNTNFGTLSALETDKKLATRDVAFGSLDEATLSSKSYIGGATFNCAGDTDLSDAEVGCVTNKEGWTAVLVKVAFGKAKPVLFSATTGPSEDTKSFVWFNSELEGGLNPIRDGGLSSVTALAS